MNKEEASRKGITKIFKKILTLFILVVLICVSCGIYYAKNLTIGYKYYDQEPTLLGITQHEDFMTQTIEEYIDSLTDKGYYIISYHLDMDIFIKKSVVQKVSINEEHLKTKIISCLDIQILTTKLIIGDNIYYFKTEQECNSFIEELNKYIKQTYTTEGSIESISIITNEAELNEKIEEVKQAHNAAIEKAKKAAAAKKQITSRSGSTLRNKNYVSGAPLEKYTYISSHYGNRSRGWHTGVDFAAPGGTDIYAWKSGTVIFSGWSGGYGKYIKVDHGNGQISCYAHCSRLAVSVGQSVVKGQVIGYVGTTGNSTGNHLHFEIMINGNFVNPLNYI